ncbi:G2 M phase-specific E3 ubiquitin-protein ligase-like [Solea senegalensis]|uniref:G2 M phase-specific E3 ubiquitin-protein ligase-like n=1 Tax=Solea senegalensis TaxID=28829 RepID=A0AAV6PBG3_SOLSE|nr:G2 M phase-specific E3 ubiquitin-protein ligase-like [Solea senegalensis]
MSSQELSGGLTEAAALLNNILASAETIRTLSNATTNGQQSHVASGADTVDSRLRTLFPSRGRSGQPQPAACPVRTSVPRYQAQQSFGIWTSGTRRRRARAQQHDHFNKDVILLPNPSWGVVCKQGTKVWLHKHGHILSAFEFQKVWDHQTVIERIRDGFGERIPEDVSLQFLMACGNKLVCPKLQKGQELNGILIHKVYKTKALYVKPSRMLLDDSEDDNQLSSNSTHSTSKMNTRSSVCISSDADDCPGASPNREERSDLNPGNSGPDSGPSTSSTRGISGPDGGCPAGNDGIPHTSGPDSGPGTSSTRAISGPDEVCLARHNGTSSLNEDNYSSYLTLVATISDDSSEDEGLQQAIIASMESHIVENVPVKKILLELASKINVNQRCRFNINRSAVWEGAIRGFKRLSYEPNLMISVKFSDDMGKNEEGVDLGGPRREFLRLLIESIAKSPMFEGKENSKNFALNSTALREDWYYIAGRAIAISLVHGGPPPNFLSPVVFSLLVDVSANPVLEDIADADLLEKVKKGSSTSTLTADQVDDLFAIRLSPEGSNKRVAEEVVITFWRDYLQDAEGTILDLNPCNLVE